MNPMRVLLAGELLVLLAIELTLLAMMSGDMVSGGETGPTSAQAQPNDTLIGYWKLDEGQGNLASDASVHHNNGSLMCNGGGCSLPEWAEGKVRFALEFNGVSGYVDCGNDQSLGMTDELTVTAWVKVNSFAENGGDRLLISRGVNGSPWSIGMVAPGKIFLALTWSDGSSAIYQPGFLPLKTWHHIAFTFSYKQGYTIVYQDGQLVGFNVKNSGMKLKASDTHLLFNASEKFNGLLDEVRIDHRVLSAGEIQELFHVGQGGPTVPEHLQPQPEP